MNSQEAITLLRNLEDALDSYCELNEEGKTAFRMAIEALSCSEIPNGSDTISRQDAIDALAKNMPSLTTPDGCGEFDHDIQVIDEAYVDCMQIIHELPSAQPERKTGRWVERNPQNSPDCRLIECSECGNAYIVGYNIDYDDWIDGRNFCMKCGADMREVSETDG